MEPEIFESYETELAHIQKKCEPKAPTYNIDYTQLINTENIAKIGVSQIKQLAEKLPSNDMFPQIKDFSNEQFKELTEKLITTKDKNIEFLYTLCNLILMCSEEGIDVLKQCGVNTGTGHIGEQVLTAYLNFPKEFEIALNRILFKSIIRDKTYHLFYSKSQIPEIKEPIVITPEVEKEFKEYFKNSNYGEFCQLKPIFPIQKSGRFGFFIEHGGNLKNKPMIDEQDKVSLFKGRNLIGDFAIYDPSLKLVLISSRSTRHCRFYSKMFGKIFWKDESLFASQFQLNLSFVNNENIQERLRGCKSNRIVDIQIKEVHTITNNINNSKTIQSIGKGCLSDDKANLRVEGGIIKVELVLKLNIKGKQRSQRLILKPTSVKCSPFVFQSDIQHIFKQLRLPTNENN